MGHLDGGISDSDVRQAEGLAYEDHYLDTEKNTTNIPRYMVWGLAAVAAIALLAIAGAGAVFAPGIAERANMF